MGHNDDVHDEEIHDEEIHDEEVRGEEPVGEGRLITPPLDAAAANAALTGDEHLDEREAAGTDEWTRLDEGAGITNPHTHSNWRVS